MNTDKSHSINDIAATHLGSAGSYAVYTDKYDSSLLVRMPRNLARKDWDITGEEWCSGQDVWHCHEATFLTANGLPVAGTLKLSYSANSEFMVESKSIKLYLNTFDMCKMGNGTIENAISCYESQVKYDLEKLLETKVYICFHEEGSVAKDPTVGFSNLLSSVSNLESIEFSDYKSESNHLLFVEDHIGGKEDIQVFTNILRSRCRHTKQKDTGSAYIRITTEGGSVDPESLLKQIVSLREENEFHEFCCEKLFCDIVKLKGVTGCMVMLLYSRRGSLDINPVRSTHSYFIPKALRDVSILTGKTQGQ